MSAFAAVAGNCFPSGSWKADQPGVSDAAKRISEILHTAVRGYVVSATGQARISDPIAGLDQLYMECEQENWDGEGAKAISPNVLEEAQMLLLVLPSTIPVPEFVPERSGRIAFEWYRSPDRVYLLSTGGNRELEFAGLLGRGNEIHGKCNFAGALPGMIADHLKAFFRR